MKSSVALTGFMGVGKSAVSKALSARMGKKLVEVDPLIERKAGKSIYEIFQEAGEVGFRELEMAVIKEIASGRNQIVDCGGGVVLNQINIDRLRQQAVIVWLTATPGAILKRALADKNKRPLLEGKSKISDIQAMLRSRKILYERAADIRIDTSHMDVSLIVEKIIDELKKYADFNS
jgi:shikimate kinase